MHKPHRKELEMSENYATVTCFDDPDRAVPVGTIGFFPSLDAAESYRYEMKELNPHCEVKIFRYTEPIDANEIDELNKP
jgi:hypothetical protein